MRRIRSHAALLALEGIAIMAMAAAMYFGALRQSMLRRVHVATWRPREAGDLDAAATRWCLRSPARTFGRLLRLLLSLMSLIGITCSFCVGFDCFEHGSVEEWLTCSTGVQMLPVFLCVGAGLNAKTVRSLLKEFQTYNVLVDVLAFVCLVLFLFRAHRAKMICCSLMLRAFRA